MSQIVWNVPQQQQPQLHKHQRQHQKSWPPPLHPRLTMPSSSSPRWKPFLASGSVRRPNGSNGSDTKLSFDKLFLNYNIISFGQQFPQDSYWEVIRATSGLAYKRAHMLSQTLMQMHTCARTPGMIWLGRDSVTWPAARRLTRLPPPKY